jgi:hypothetical protein
MSFQVKQFCFEEIRIDLLSIDLQNLQNSTEAAAAIRRYRVL